MQLTSSHCSFGHGGGPYISFWNFLFHSFMKKGALKWKIGFIIRITEKLIVHSIFIMQTSMCSFEILFLSTVGTLVYLSLIVFELKGYAFFSDKSNHQFTI